MLRKYGILLAPAAVFCPLVFIALELYLLYSVFVLVKRTITETNWKMPVSKANKSTIAAAVVFALGADVILLSCFVLLLDLLFQLD